MAADALKEAINLIKTGQMIEARKIIEPIIIANPQNIQAWLWEIETWESNEDKIKVMKSCLLHNPDSTLIQKSLTALQNRLTSPGVRDEKVTGPLVEDSSEFFSAASNHDQETPVEPAIEEKMAGQSAESQPQINIQASMDGFTALEDEKYLTVEPCPFCGELIRSGSRVCPTCERVLLATSEPLDKSKKVTEVMPVGELPQEMREPVLPRMNIDFSDLDFGELTDETAIVIEPCPFCGELIKEGSEYCEACGRELKKEESKEPASIPDREKVKWYRRTWVRVLLFIFLMPVWCILTLSESEEKPITKVLAGVISAFFVTLGSLLLFWFLATNSSKANLLNWYRAATGQDQPLPGTILRVEGSVQNPGVEEFGLLELQARVYDQDGNLVGINRQYMGSSVLPEGVPTRFHLDVTPLLSSLGSGLIDQKVLLFDDFSSLNSGWNLAEAEEGSTVLSEGQLKITVNDANFDLWSNPGVNFEDVKIEVDTTKLSGPEDNRVGIQCRYADPDNYYFAIISSDGYYGIGKVVDGAQSILPENGMRPSQTIYAGKAINHIRFDCVGTKLTLYVNGDYVDAVEDNDLIDGDVGLLAGTFKQKGVEVSFDNLLVLTP